jgi:RNA polymerase-binding transcription factor DksA
MATIPAKKATAPAKQPARAAKAPAAKAGAPAAKAKTSAPTAAKKPAVAKKAAPPRSAAPVAKKAPAKKAPALKAPAGKAAVAKAPAPKAAPKKEGGSTRAAGSFDAAFLASQRALLTDERANLVGQAQRLEDEAAELMEDLDPGDVQFDDESGEGDSLVVERERDLALSAQARQTVSDIDAALGRIQDGTYGYSVVSGRPIPKERLRAIPWATELVEEKVGGLGTRR